jgi:leucyl aminopeptidase
VEECLIPAGAAVDAVPVRLVRQTDNGLGGELSDMQRAYVAAIGFEPKAGRIALVPGSDGRLGLVLFGLGGEDDIERTPLLPGKLAELLPKGTYALQGAAESADLAALAFALGSYRFSAYRTVPDGNAPRLFVPDGVDHEEVSRIAAGVNLARDLINTPANDMGPAELEAAARTLAEEHGATFEAVVGDDLLESGLPLIHAVGRASSRPPRLIDLRWGPAGAPAVTLVGKGVCFDTGGLDIKPASGMALMKKDMGGAACVLGLASMIMSAALPVRLRVLVPAVENAISANAFRPGDVLRSRAGITVAIGNTDAEGRLVLADAITLAGEEDPQLIIDMATLTGAARVALGPTIPPFYTHNDDLAADISEAARRVYDPVWRMPLWRPYERMLDSKIADIDNAGSGGMAGSITAALFLSRFVRCPSRWSHFDVYGWNPSARAGHPEGGDAQAIRALYDMLARRYGNGAG